MSVDISMLGDKELEKAFNRLDDKVMKKVVRSGLTKSAALIRKSVRDRVPGKGEKHRKLKKGIKSYAWSFRGFLFGRSVEPPTREELGIDPKDKHYWPAALEFGHDNVPPYSYLRAGFDAVESRLFPLIRDTLWAGVRKVWDAR